MTDPSRSHQVTEQDGDWILNIQGYTSYQCCVAAYRFTLDVVRNDAADDLWGFSFNGRFLFHSKDGVDHWLNAYTDSAGCGPALELAVDVIDYAIEHKDGRLEIAFRSGARVEVPVDPDSPYEGFELGNQRGVLIVQNPAPEGGLAVWAPE